MGIASDTSTCTLNHARLGFTLVELVTLLGVLAIVSVVTVPSAAAWHGRASTAAAGRELAAVLREAQAAAQDGACRTRVAFDDSAGYVVSTLASGTWVVTERGSGGAVACTTNYPGGVIEFSSRGWPCAGGSTVPRAGSLVVSWGPRHVTVVLQLTGAIRCQ